MLDGDKMLASRLGSLIPGKNILCMSGRYVRRPQIQSGHTDGKEQVPASAGNRIQVPRQFVAGSTAERACPLG
jgi:hypothetical protein